MTETIISLSLRSVVPLTLAMLMLLAVSNATAQTTNALSDAEIQGRALAQKVLQQQPAGNSTNTGRLKIRVKNRRMILQVTCETVVTETNWLNRYQVRDGTNASDVTVLVVTHAGTEPNHYRFFESGKSGAGRELTGNETAIPLAGSDFWLCDLGLEFLHWPQQKILPNPTPLKLGRAYSLLESTNPNPGTNGYSRVLTWIDKESGGPLAADAYAANGTKLKEFEPKSLEKVNGAYQVESMVMVNRLTDSQSLLEFDLNP